MNTTITEDKWKVVKGEIRKAWGALKDDELEKTKGNFESIADLLQKRFGYAKDDARQRLSEVIEDTEKSAHKMGDKAAKKVRNISSRAREKIGEYKDKARTEYFNR